MESFQYSDLLQIWRDSTPSSLDQDSRRDRMTGSYEAFEVLRRVEEASRQGRETGTYAATRSAKSCHSVIDWGHHRRGGGSHF